MTAPGKRRQRIQILSEQPTLLPGQLVAKIEQALGENTYQVLLADGRRSLYRLPKRLRQLAYIRRGSFVFVREHAEVRGRITGDIDTIVLSRFIPSITKEDFWPECFRVHNNCECEEQRELENSEEKEEGAEEEWKFGEGNPNRRVWDHFSSSSEESAGEDEDEDEEEEEDNESIAKKERKNPIELRSS